MLEISNLQVSRGDFTAKLAHLLIKPGQCVALCGVSGSGKSTLLEAIGLLTLGFVVDKFKVCGIDLTQLNDAQRQALRIKYMGIMPQVGGLLPFLTIEENWKLQIKLAQRQAPIFQPDAPSEEKEEYNGLKGLVDERVVACLGLTEHIHKLPEQLSIGQRQRALFVRAIAHRPKLLLIDEPTSSLDPDNARVLFKLIEEIAAATKMGVLIVTHDLQAVADYPQYVYKAAYSHPGFAYFGAKEA